MLYKVSFASVQWTLTVVWAFLRTRPFAWVSRKCFCTTVKAILQSISTCAWRIKFEKSTSWATLLWIYTNSFFDTEPLFRDAETTSRMYSLHPRHQNGYWCSILLGTIVFAGWKSVVPSQKVGGMVPDFWGALQFFSACKCGYSVRFPKPCHITWSHQSLSHLTQTWILRSTNSVLYFCLHAVVCYKNC